MPQYLETSFYLVGARFEALKGLFLHLRSFPTRRVDCVAWESLFQGGSLLESEGFPVPFTGAKFSFSSEKFSFESTGILFSGIQNVQRGALSSAVDMPESLSYLTPYGLEQVWTNLMISTSVDSFCSNLWFRVHEREFYLHHLLLRAL